MRLLDPDSRPWLPRPGKVERLNVVTERKKAPEHGHFSINGVGRFRVRAGELMPPGAKFISAADDAKAMQNAPASAGDARAARRNQRASKAKTENRIVKDDSENRIVKDDSETGGDVVDDGSEAPDAGEND